MLHRLTRFVLLLSGFTILPLYASQCLETTRAEEKPLAHITAKEHTYLEEFFELPPLHNLTRDLRKQLLPLCFCASVIKRPLRDINCETWNTDDPFSALAFGSKSTHLAYVQRMKCSIENILTCDKKNGRVTGMYWDKDIAGIAFNSDDSKIAYISSDGSTFVACSLESSCLEANSNRITHTVIENQWEIDNLWQEEDRALARSGPGSSAVTFNSKEQIVAIKKFKEVTVTDQGAKEFFCVACEDSKCKGPTIVRCVQGNLAAFAGLHCGITLFSCETKSCTNILEEYDISAMVAMNINKDETLLLAAYDHSSEEIHGNSYRIEIFNVISEESFSVYVNTGPWKVESATFTSDSQYILILTAQNSLLYHIPTGTLVATYPHENRGLTNVEPNQKPALRYQCVSPDGKFFARSSPYHVEIYAFDPLVSLINDADLDKGALERILFIQFLRLITRLGLSLTHDGFRISSMVLPWGKQSSVELCDRLNLDKKHEAFKELEQVFTSFTLPLQDYLKKRYDLPWVGTKK